MQVFPLPRESIDPLIEFIVACEIADSHGEHDDDEYVAARRMARRGTGRVLRESGHTRGVLWEFFPEKTRELFSGLPLSRREDSASRHIIYSKKLGESKVIRTAVRNALVASVFTTALPVVAAGAAEPEDVLATVIVTPLPGAELQASQIPAPVQTATSEDIDRSHALDLSAFMNRSLGSVYVNDVQNNPLQPDINFRGYTASPLLGTPQGLSVYLDGVRLNQPFGDVVSWDLIPRQAIASLTLIPGSNPVFGLNTLGGGAGPSHQGRQQRSWIVGGAELWIGQASECRG